MSFNTDVLMSDQLELALQISELTLCTNNSLQLTGTLYFCSISFRFSTVYSVWNLSLTSFESLSDTGGPVSSDELNEVIIWDNDYVIIVYLLILWKEII